MIADGERRGVFTREDVFGSIDPSSWRRALDHARPDLEGTLAFIRHPSSGSSSAAIRRVSARPRPRSACVTTRR